MHIIDLRSDTLTKPTPEMREAMARAEVGDDVFGEDPTVNRLQEMSAKRLGKEAALFVASGTMGNLVSLISQCGRGDEVIIGDQAHIYINEQGGSAGLGSIHPRVIRNQPDGTLDLDEVESVIRGVNVHYPVTKLVAVENTHNLCNGAPLSVEYMNALGALARKHGLLVHVDGARIFNAAVALGVNVKELAVDADSITFCLSKGLAAPVGSMICGSKEFIDKARRARKVVGGGMRQAGVLAAAGIYALEHMVTRLAEDHCNAQLLVDGISQIPGISCDPVNVRTDIVYMTVTRPGMTASDLARRLAERGVRVLALGPQRVRAVTNYHVTAADIAEAIEGFRVVMA